MNWTAIKAIYIFEMARFFPHLFAKPDFTCDLDIVVFRGLWCCDWQPYRSG